LPADPSIMTAGCSGAGDSWDDLCPSEQRH
jgi:hypothetical protein